jgi:hypothetical protein
MEVSHFVQLLSINKKNGEKYKFVSKWEALWGQVQTPLLPTKAY